MHVALCNSFENMIAVQVSYPVSDAPLHNLRRTAQRRQRAAYRPGYSAMPKVVLSNFLPYTDAFHVTLGIPFSCFIFN